jgi:glucose/arabinose dehydrogenase/RNase P/RNase MRP subunit p29
MLFSSFFKILLKTIIVLLLFIGGLFLFSEYAVAAPPTGFSTTQIVGAGLNGPTSFAFAPDGRIFILERTGAIKIYKQGQLLATPFATLPSQSTGDRGLIGVAFDPNYAANHFVYFYYTGADKINRLVRLDASTDVATTDPAIIYQTTFLSEQLHVGGSIVFGPDGKLYFAVGDNGYPPNAQDLSNPHGKLLRINADGSIPSDNPFVGQSGALPEIWAYGFRNPWRLTFDSVTGFLYDGDVGNDTWEEIDRVVPGANYGWPVCEGPCSNPAYTSPIYYYNHDSVSSSVTLGPVYRSSLFPSTYTGKLFFGDYARGFIKTLGLDANGNSTGATDFDLNAGSVVDLKIAADGSLYYLTYYPGRLYRVSYSTANLAPVANASADATKGTSPFTVHFSSDGSMDPNSDPLTYSWDFGDGTTSNQAYPVKTYTQNGTYVVEMSVSDGQTTAQAIPITIQVGIAPTVIVNVPADGSFYNAGDSITYNASAIDGVGNDLNDANIMTEVRFHHHTHFHPFYGPTAGRVGTFTIPTTGEKDPDTWYEILVTATDTNGLSTTKTVLIYPRKVHVTFQTEPSGLALALEGSSFSAPSTIEQVVNFRRELQAITPQLLNGQLYRFDHFSDGGAQIHTITVPSTDQTITAYFVPATSDAFVGEYFSNQNLTGAPTFVREDQTIDFNWQGAPTSQLPPDHFSVRWTKQQNFAAGWYTFTTKTDDGVRLKVDGQTIIDKWQDQSALTYNGTINLTQGNHTIVMEYYENSGGAVANLTYAPSGQPDVTPTPQPTASPAPVTPSPTPITTADPNAFFGEYFSNQNLTGSPVFLRNDPTITFDWGEGTPNVLLPVDHFSVRWTKQQLFAAGTYAFTTTSDDGVRLKIDGELILDKWIDQSPKSYTVSKILTAGTHTIVMEYYENGGGAVANLSWIQTATATPQPTIAPTPTPVGTVTPTANFLGEYYPNQTFSGNPAFTRQDGTITFDWGQGSPDSSIPVDHFSVRWTKQQNFSVNGVYRFVSKTDDGVRVKVDGQTVIDKWQDQSSKEWTGDITLTAGVHTIVMEYYENGGDAVAKLNWSLVSEIVDPGTFTGEYFSNQTLTGTPAVTRQDSSIAFNWGEGSPHASIPVDHFSVRWSRTTSFLSGTYAFTVRADDGVRLKIDGQVVLDKWIDQSPTTYVVSVPLTSQTCQGPCNA